MTTDVLIHVADGQLLDGIDYAGRIEEHLSSAGLSTVRVDLTAAPADAAPPRARAHVFTGGETSVHSAQPWMRAALRTARQLIASSRPVVGICLGSQILAEALRADSIVETSGIEVGLTPVVRPDRPDVSQVVPSFHYQAISSELAAVPGVRIEWGNHHTAVQAFSYGETVFGCQYHPELSAADVHTLIDLHADVITRWNGDVAAAHRSVDEHRDALAPDLFRRTVLPLVTG
jgi:GMP synthase-like glutamine amidotransferase